VSGTRRGACRWRDPRSQQARAADALAAEQAPALTVASLLVRTKLDRLGHYGLTTAFARKQVCPMTTSRPCVSPRSVPGGLQTVVGAELASAVRPFPALQGSSRPGRDARAASEAGRARVLLVPASAARRATLDRVLAARQYRGCRTRRAWRSWTVIGVMSREWGSAPSSRSTLTLGRCCGHGVGLFPPLARRSKVNSWQR
jgi:hypothetical protein